MFAIRSAAPIVITPAWEWPTFRKRPSIDVSQTIGKPSEVSA